MSDPGHLFDGWNDEADAKPEYADRHIIGRSQREFYLIFGQEFPTDEKIRTVGKIILSREHMMELYQNIGRQIKQFDDQNKDVGVRKEFSR